MSTKEAPKLPTLDDMVAWYLDWEEATSNERKLCERDRDYYDGDQWTREEIKELERRKQPVVTINRIAPKVNYIIGSEIAARVDANALPRRPDVEMEAQTLTDALRFVADDQRFDQRKTEVGEEIMVEGAGGALIGIADDDGWRKKVSITHIPWDRLWWDPHSRDPAFADAKYMGIVTWMDLEDAVDAYGRKNGVVSNYADLIQSTINDWATNTTHEDKPLMWADSKRKRVQTLETYFHIGRKWYVAHWVRGGLLVAPKLTGYHDEQGNDENPLILGSGFVSRQCQRRGIVRDMIPIQDEINKRRSKMMHLINVNRVLYEEGAIDDVNEFQTQRAMPDGAAKVSPGALASGAVRPEENTELAQSQFSLLQEAKSEIDTMGPSAQTMIIGENTAGESGRAMMLRQKAGSLQMGKLFDHMSDWEYRAYVAVWHRIKEFMPYEWWARLRDDKEKTGYRFVIFNKTTTKGGRVKELVANGMPLPSALQAVRIENPQALVQLAGPVMQQAQQAAQQGVQVNPDQLMAAALEAMMQSPEMREPYTINDLSKMEVDIVLDRIPDTAVIEQEEFNSLLQVVPVVATALSVTNPATIAPLFAALVKASQLRSKQDLVDAIEPKQDPQAAQAQAQAQTTQQALQAAAAQAGIQKTQAQAHQAEATAEKTEAEIQLLPVQAQESVAQAMVHAANAGEKTGGMMPGPVAQHPGPPPGMGPQQ